MLQFHLINTLEKHAIRTDYHCGLYQSENARSVVDCWLDPCSLAASKGILVSFFSLRLLICLSSARSLAWAEVKRNKHEEKIKKIMRAKDIQSKPTFLTSLSFLKIIIKNEKKITCKHKGKQQSHWDVLRAHNKNSKENKYHDFSIQVQLRKRRENKKRKC